MVNGIFLRAAFQMVGLGAGVGLLGACEEIPRTYSTKPPAGHRVVADDFNRAALGPSWNPTGPGAVLDNGRLKLSNLRNHPVWLTQPLPDDVRIEFDAWAATDQGDIKVELAGDGASHATSPNYVATGYVLIFGGWNNRLNVLARRDEHGQDRVTSDEPLPKPGKRYHFVITRSGGELRWEINGREIANFEDRSPLRGPGHRHFAFSAWEAETHFDNLVIEAL